MSCVGNIYITLRMWWDGDILHWFHNILYVHMEIQLSFLYDLPKTNTVYKFTKATNVARSYMFE